MIDFHTHILPNIDDGARSIEETFNLIKEAKNAGFEGIISTSHYKEGYFETDTPEREVWIKAIYENLQAKNVNIKLYLGNEIYMTKNIINLLEEQKASTINDTSYVLIELPINTEPDDLYDVVYEIIQNKLVPILAHPERYTYIQKEPELAYELIQQGMLMQANYGSIIGEYGEKAKIIVKKFLENNYIHFLGTDVHKQNTIYARIPEILAILNSLIGEQKMKELTTKNPWSVIRNKKINIIEPIPVKLTIKERLIMNFKKGS